MVQQRTVRFGMCSVNGVTTRYFMLRHDSIAPGPTTQPCPCAWYHRSVLTRTGLRLQISKFDCRSDDKNKMDYHDEHISTEQWKTNKVENQRNDTKELERNGAATPDPAAVVFLDAMGHAIDLLCCSRTKSRQRSSTCKTIWYGWWRVSKSSGVTPSSSSRVAFGLRRKTLVLLCAV